MTGEIKISDCFMVAMIILPLPLPIWGQQLCGNSFDGWKIFGREACQ